MRRVRLEGAADFSEWRREARSLLADGVKPEDVVWEEGNQTLDLFAEQAAVSPVAKVKADAPRVPSVPKGFIELAASAICHSDPERFARLYRLLWRVQSERGLLQITSDADVMQAEAWSKAVRRDVHKMHAFVRFRRVAPPDDEESEAFVAWFEPDHHIVERAAPFFKKRFSTMRWSILTPMGSVHWDREKLRFTGPQSAADAPPDDALDAWWRIYYRSIFNPARLKIGAMRAEMPKKYWKNMPETRLIPELVKAAAVRTEAMIGSAPTAAPVRHQRQQQRAEAILNEREDRAASLDELREKAAGCRACPLWRDAERLVFGEGPAHAELCIVGEQPGDQEDLSGRPFVGPAGKLLDDVLSAADIDRGEVYLTNAVKHFKFTQRGKRRLHQRPNAGEIDHCRWWLAEELRLLNPRLVIALGATAARSLFQRPLAVRSSRGRILDTDEGLNVLVTTHPSYLLRLPDTGAKDAAFDAMVQDFRMARDHLDLHSSPKIASSPSAAEM